MGTFKKEYERMWGIKMIRNCVGAKFVYRDTTRDMYVVSDVFDNNKYQVPDDLQNKVVVDVGANIGAFAILCATKGAKVYAIEPYSKNFELLVKNIKLNGLENRVVPYSLGIGTGDKNTLYINKDRPDFCSFDSEMNPEGMTAEEEVETITLEKLYQDIGKSVDYLKCDAEGAERFVVGALKRGLHKKTGCVMAELHYWTDELNHTGSDEKDTLDTLYTSRTNISDYEFIWKK